MRQQIASASKWLVYAFTTTALATTYLTYIFGLPSRSTSPTEPTVAGFTLDPVDVIVVSIFLSVFFWILAVMLRNNHENQ